jgi:hypothetical protein
MALRLLRMRVTDSSRFQVQSTDCVYDYAGWISSLAHVVHVFI